MGQSRSHSHSKEAAGKITRCSSAASAEPTYGAAITVRPATTCSFVPGRSTSRKRSGPMCTSSRGASCRGWTFQRLCQRSSPSTRSTKSGQPRAGSGCVATALPAARRGRSREKVAETRGNLGFPTPPRHAEPGRAWRPTGAGSMLAPMARAVTRCGWCGTDPLYVSYHDEEWGVPVHDDQRLFEFLILEGAQAGLSWETILKKRETYRKAFDQFEPAVVAGYGQKKIDSLLADPGIIRNRLKIAAAIQNAKAFLAVQKEFGTFDVYIWQFVNGRAKQNAWKTFEHVPAKTAESDAMSKDLKRRGFKFVGSTICYAFMQAVGMVNDHVIDCFRHADLQDCQ